MYYIVLKDELTTQEKRVAEAESYGEACALLPHYAAIYSDEGLELEIEEDV